jgi:uncharacterized protein
MSRLFLAFSSPFWLMLLVSVRDFWLSLPPLLRGLTFFGVWLGLWLPIALVLSFALGWHPPQPLGNKKLPFLASLYILVPFLLWGVIRIEGVSPLVYGLGGNTQFLGSMGLGWFLGVICLTILFTQQWLFGWFKWSFPNFNTSSEQVSDTNNGKAAVSLSAFLLTLLVNFILGLWVSATEEVIFRGFLQTELQGGFSVLISAAIVSVIFAFAHLIWEVKDTLPQIPGLLLMGMVLTLARITDNDSLGIAIGLHGGWIFAIASIDTFELIKYTGKVPEWVTGIGGKPLAGMIGIVLLGVTAVILTILKY